MSEDGSITISARGALVTGLISILLSPFALVLGYYVNRVVAGPKTAVVDTNAAPVHQIDPKVVATASARLFAGRPAIWKFYSSH